MTTQDMLDERYGRTRSPRRSWTIGIVAAIAVILVGLFAWMTVAGTLDDVRADATGFTVLDPHAVEISFQITAPEGRSVACALEAQDEEHGVVGWKIVEYPASELRSRAFREKIPTTAPSTTGLVNACWVT
ncbi:DUF4307 domain-containing protein [Microbacterium sp. zg.B48]|uniref:DUF4307 domain-containing protein n=1 Tax=unclassified Microbacterium TaxID=2609290 RepID=UPI00214AD10A|nr:MULTISPECIES: DUF4307 domain-containing protein [unclassified Microbacterium]MCR2762290.1 DUF4307 domain-containing protein [Microbacterium sp. zg.B48]MCR2809704.1 DUF4307 domain-containing protein [Microbacterium sp. zg.B185]WIM17978.1 DUF4307 domain-containing protein [Microbacterium sp. zg-B185]